MKNWPLICIACTVCSGVTQAGTNLLQVDEKNGAYTLQMLLQLQGDATTVINRLTDFDHLDRISPAIQSSEKLGITEDGGNLVRTVVKGCVLFFCKTMERVEAVFVEEGGRIHARILPERSDFIFGYTEWLITADSGAVNIEYHSRIMPKFSVPAGIGTYMVKYILRRELQYTAEYLQYGE